MSHYKCAVAGLLILTLSALAFYAQALKPKALFLTYQEAQPVLEASKKFCRQT